MTDTESAFIEEPLLDGEITGLHLLHESSGGFCQVYLAEKYRQFIVLKCLKPGLRGDPVYEALLRKEFETGYGLNHPSLCRILALTEHPALGTCIEMEWVDGVTLRQRFSTRKPDGALFRKIAGELCDAVAYL
ncbi:MAG: hypothetical protein IKX37_03010, partial [Bacteroidales bacterium]|nr:hypothetical protein [Bacteroidales bacterium]